MQLCIGVMRNDGETERAFEAVAVVDRNRRFHAKFVAPQDNQVTIYVRSAEGGLLGRFAVPTKQVAEFDPTEVQPFNLARKQRADNVETIAQQPENEIAVEPANCGCDCPPRFLQYQFYADCG